MFDVPLCWTAVRSRVGDTFDRTCPSIIIRAQYSRMGIIMKSASTEKVCVVSLPVHHARCCSKHVREHQQGITPCSKKKTGNHINADPKKNTCSMFIYVVRSTCRPIARRRQVGLIEQTHRSSSAHSRVMRPPLSASIIGAFGRQKRKKLEQRRLTFFFNKKRRLTFFF